MVDDEQAFREVICALFAGSPIEVVGAKDADEAEAILSGRADEPLLTLVDVLMPGTDGLTLARRLRRRLRRGMIVIISGHLTDLAWWPEDLRDVEFLPKPVRHADLQALLDRARVGYRRKP